MFFKKRLSAQLKTELDGFIRAVYAPPHTAAEDAVVGDAMPAPRAIERDLTDSIPMPRADRAVGIYGAKPERKEKAVNRFYAPAAKAAMPMPTASAPSFENRFGMLDESFQEMLLRKIDEKGIRDSECYKRAGIDRKLFSKIRSNPMYKPKKSTAIAFCMALELPYDEAVEMLRKAGYALSRSSKFDVIVEYFLRNRRYSFHELNCALYEYDQNLIGN